MAWTVPRTDVLLKVLGAPHQTELVCSLFRLSAALLDSGATVQVWTCAEATGLTRAGLGDRKPRDPADRMVRHPSTAGLVRELLAGAPGRISWYACRFCCVDRGAIEDQFADVLYFVHGLHRQSGGVELALRGAAAGFAVQADRPPALRVAGRLLDTLPDPRRSVQLLLDDGVAVWAEEPMLSATQ